ncbi:hypothetical protein AB0G04_21280 [Actinoplanes sp. NPDC023801]|uniref:hypothetical protein n=1 Tax=Actinoplanes sp. NPDC023801 TaxID=3154595 RepID=UPI0033E9B6DF
MIPQRSSSIWKVIGCVSLVVAGGLLLWLPFHTSLILEAWKVELKATGVPAQAFVHDRITKEGGNRASASTTMYLRYAGAASEAVPARRAGEERW